MEERKKAKMVEKKQKALEWQSSDHSSAHSMIICPQYKFSEETKSFVEVDIPPTELYKPVGFNNLETVK